MPDLFSGTGNPHLDLYVHRPTRGTERLLHFLSNGLPSSFGQRRQRLTSRAAAMLKRSVVGIKRREDERVLFGPTFDIAKTGLREKQPQSRCVPERESASGGLRQLWHVPRHNHVDPAAVGPFGNCQDGDRSAPTKTQHAVEPAERTSRIGEKH